MGEKHGCYSMEEWKKENKKAHWKTKDVPGDGMCGWTSLLVIIGWLMLDDIQLKNKKPDRWKPEGWQKLLDFLKEVSNFIRTTLKGPRTDLTNHLVSAMSAEDNDTLGDNMTLTEGAYISKKFRALQLASLLSPQQPLQQPESKQQVDTELWFNLEYGNIVSAMLGRPIVVLQQVEDARALRDPKVYFPFFTPGPIPPTTWMTTPGLQSHYGSWNAFNFAGLRRIFQDNGFSNPMHIQLTQYNCHYQPFYKSRPGAELSRLCPVFHTHHTS